MPKPLFLARRSGLYVRFLVPADLRLQIGSRFLVRPLHLPSGDLARLAVARMGVALCEAFHGMRMGDAVDIKSKLDLVIGQVRLGNGTVLTDVRVDTPQDERQLKSLMEASGIKPVPPQVPQDLFLKQMNIHLSDLERAGRQAKTVLESRHTLALFLGLVGNKAVSKITDEHCRQFLDDVRYWPKHATQRPEFATLSVADILKKSKASDDEPRPAQATLNKHRQRLSVFFNWLKKNKRITDNPLLGVMSQRKEDAEEETGRGFIQIELDAVFEPSAYEAWAKEHPHKWWVPMLGLYSGARVNELSQLYVKDIEKVVGIWGFHVTRRFKGQKIKGLSSKRFVPLAQPILDAGFLTYVSDVQKAGHKRLFPHLPNNDGNGFGKQMSKHFAAYIKKRGVIEEGMGMHAFRHTLANNLSRQKYDDGNKIEKLTISKITGHKVPGTVLDEFYIDPPTLPERAAALAKFNPHVSLLTYKKGQFNERLKEAHDLPAIWAEAKKKRSKKIKRAAG